MENKFIPSNEELKGTDCKNPEVDSKSPVSIITLVCLLGMIAVIFIPWFAAGIKGDGDKIMFQSLGIANWYGIVGLVAAVLAAIGMIYKHYSLTFCSTLAAVVIGIIGLTNTPETKIKVKFADKDTKEVLNEVLEEYDIKIKDITKIKLPSIVTEIVDQAFKFADQRAITKLLKKSEILDELGIYVYADDIKIIHHRLGALLFLCLSALATACAYLLIAGPCRCCAKKEEETIVAAE